MKRKPVPLFRIGIFVIAGFVLLIVFVFLIGSKNNIFTDTVEMRSTFATVNSLKKGAQVQMAGINVGSVKEILLPKNSKDRVVVVMSLQKKALPLIHTDSRATITTEGLIGEKLVLITLGSDSLPALAEGSIITGEASKDFTKIADTLGAAIARVNELTEETKLILELVHSGNGTISKLLNDKQLYVDLDAVTVQAKRAVSTAQVAVDKISTDFGGLTTRFGVIGDDVSAITSRINRGEGSLGKFLHDEDIYKGLNQTSENLRLSSLDLRDAFAKLSLGAGRFAEVTEAFKHNFLVKGYFEDRGYWDAPEFEMTIDKKLDSLEKMKRDVGEQVRIMNANSAEKK